MRCCHRILPLGSLRVERQANVSLRVLMRT